MKTPPPLPLALLPEKVLLSTITDLKRGLTTPLVQSQGHLEGRGEKRLNWSRDLAQKGVE
jgi:hypothetical protein